MFFSDPYGVGNDPLFFVENKVKEKYNWQTSVPMLIEALLISHSFV